MHIWDLMQQSQPNYLPINPILKCTCNDIQGLLEAAFSPSSASYKRVWAEVHMNLPKSCGSGLFPFPEVQEVKSSGHAGYSRYSTPSRQLPSKWNLPW